ncbi:hypothetical protein LguiB_008685 [Lonicera macranthoides]
MKASTLVHSSHLLSIFTPSYPSTRTHLSFPRKLFSSQAKYDGPLSSRVVPAKLLAAEKEEAKAVLTLFLKKQGLSKAVATRTANKSRLFIDHLISRLHYVHKSRYLVGQELTTPEIRDVLNPYLETLLEEHGEILVDLVENFPSSPLKESSEENFEKATAEERLTATISPPSTTIDSKKLKDLSRVSDIGPARELYPHILYLMDLGMELGDIEEMIHKFPYFSYYSLEGNIKPVVEFLLDDLGVPKSDIPTILSKRPQLCGFSLSKNVIPTITFLEKLGMDKTQCTKVIYRFPALLTYSRQKLTATVDFLYEMGLSNENVGKILTRFPNIVCYSVEDKLHPTAEYFHSLGVDVAFLLVRCPHIFSLSIEANLKPVTEFFLERGYSLGDVRTMISRYAALYSLSLAEDLIPKWEFFLTMHYPKSELIKFPQYFGYSLEERIKPRYAIMKGSRVRLALKMLLVLSDHKFNKLFLSEIEENDCQLTTLQACMLCI